MGSADLFRAGLAADRRTDAALSPPGGLMDVLAVAAVVLDSQGRIVLWSPQAEELLGYTPQEALGQYAAQLLVADEHFDLVLSLFQQVMESGQGWEGVFRVRHKDGSTRLLEWRNMRLQDDLGGYYALGLATDQPTLRRVERDLALSVRLVDQSPIGLAVLGDDLRYVAVNPALERIGGRPAGDLIGRSIPETLPFGDAESLEAAMREVLASGAPLLDRHVLGRVPSDPVGERAWSVSLYRLEDPGGRVLGIALSVVDVTDRHRAATEAERARRRLALVADASVRIGTTLDLEQTARELADVAVPELADVAAVDVLDSVLVGPDGRPDRRSDDAPMLIRALAVAAAYPTVAVEAADRPGELARYDAGRLVTQCVNTARPVTIPRLGEQDLRDIARDSRAAGILAEAGVHSYMAVPLIARGEVLGALDLKRARNPDPFTEDDVLLATEFAARAAVCIDNARWYRQQRQTALTLQRSMLPETPEHLVGLEVASRYQPARANSEVGGDWFDIIPMDRERTALVVGDVMGSGINAATAMGRLRTATQTLARLALDPAVVLRHLDEITAGLDPYIATCMYAVYDPHRAQCCIANAGHLPPVLVRSGCAPRLLDLPTGTPLGVGGVGGVALRSITVGIDPGDVLVLYTDGLVETRDQDIDVRLNMLLDLLKTADATLGETCDRLLHALRRPDAPDDVALLLARVTGS
ncbi:SpoIIE family protein phosphatase [Streptomyces sp. PKU-EA00015]|uniref:SpoIIE family protein phosphatase n=1 Tax=Streptomyces sp. PKU-EA00015 TaxID=2748326 RepID=UPI0035C86553